jgi:aminoglycoside phosphotransferase (APT) family kinase protein
MMAIRRAEIRCACVRRKAVNDEPSVQLAAEIAARVISSAADQVRRFTTGARHYVFEVTFADRPPVVVRIGSTTAQSDMAGAVYLSGLLRPRGVPMPAILAQDTRAKFPWLVLERLSGTDLGEVIDRLSDGQLDQIAAEIARAQAVTGEISTAGRYGYAVLPDQPPHAAWSRVLDDNLARSLRRITSAGLFDVGFVGLIGARLAAFRDEVDEIRPIAFLHDTTMRNVIITARGDLSGIVDVDDLCFGDPRYPAALTLSVLMARGHPAHYVSAWLRHAGYRDDPIFRLYVSLFLLDLMSEHGREFNGNQPPSTVDNRAALYRAFESNLHSFTPSGNCRGMMRTLCESSKGVSMVKVSTGCRQRRCERKHHEVAARVGCREARCLLGVKAEVPVVFWIAQHEDSDPPFAPSALYRRSNQR